MKKAKKKAKRAKAEVRWAHVEKETGEITHIVGSPSHTRLEASIRLMPYERLARVRITEVKS